MLATESSIVLHQTDAPAYFYAVHDSPAKTNAIVSSRIVAEEDPHMFHKQVM
jgi:hypothetical protein